MAHGRNYKIGTPRPPREWDPCTCAGLRGVQVDESVVGSRRVKVSDGACGAIDIIPVAPRNAEDAMLREELASRGFVERADDKMVRSDGDVVVSIDITARKVSVDSSGEKTVEAEGRDPAALEAALQRAAGRAEEHLVAEIAERLEGHLPGLQREMEGVAARVAGRALEIRARSMGEVESITGSATEGTLEIRVRV